MAGGADEAVWAASLRKGRDDWEQILTAVADLYVHGCDIDWEALPGFLPKLRTHLYYPDDQELLNGRVDRRRLMGDPLILAARLLSLAKKVGAAIAFAFLPGDHPRYERIEDIQAKLGDVGLAPAFSLSREVRSLPTAHQEWIERWHVEPYGLVRNVEQDLPPGA